MLDLKCKSRITLVQALELSLAGSAKHDRAADALLAELGVHLRLAPALFAGRRSIAHGLIHASCVMQATAHAE